MSAFTAVGIADIQISEEKDTLEICLGSNNFGRNYIIIDVKDVINLLKNELGEEL